MTGTAIIILIVIMIIGIIFLSQKPSMKKFDLKDFLGKMAFHLESKYEPIEGVPNSYFIKFKQMDEEFWFEYIEDQWVKGQPYVRSYLKLQVPYPFTLSFSEGTRTSITAPVTSINEVVTPWMKNIEKVRVPKKLESFEIFANDIRKANKLLSDENVVKILYKWTNLDALGHSVMSFEIVDGRMTLKFHKPDEMMNPNLVDLLDNPSALDDSIKAFRVIYNKIALLYKEDE